MTYPLMIDNQARAIIFAARQTAEHNVLAYAEMERRAKAADQGETVGLLNADFTVQIPVSYTATYTHEEHVPGVLFRHLSVAIMGGQPERGPHPAVMREIMAEFKFQNDLENVEGWLETLSDGRLAINVLEPLDGDWSAVRTAMPVPHVALESIVAA